MLRFEDVTRRLQRCPAPGLIPILKVDNAKGRIPWALGEARPSQSLERQQPHLTQRTLDLKRAVHLAQQLLLSVAALHAAGFAHGRLGPHAFSWRSTEEGDSVQLADLGRGWSNAPGQVNAVDGAGLSLAPSWKGDEPWRLFQPPEASPDEVSAQHDLYAVGVMLHFMLTGRLPYQPRLASELLRAMRQGAPLERVSLADRRAELTRQPSLLKTLERAVSVRAEERFSHAQELLRALEGSLAGSLPPPQRSSALAKPPPKRASSFQEAASPPPDVPKPLGSGAVGSGRFLGRVRERLRVEDLERCARLLLDLEAEIERLHEPPAPSMAPVLAAWLQDSQALALATSPSSAPPREARPLARDVGQSPDALAEAILGAKSTPLRGGERGARWVLGISSPWLRRLGVAPEAGEPKRDELLRALEPLRKSAPKVEEARDNPKRGTLVWLLDGAPSEVIAARVLKALVELGRAHRGEPPAIALAVCERPQDGGLVRLCEQVEEVASKAYSGEVLATWEALGGGDQGGLFERLKGSRCERLPLTVWVWRFGAPPTLAERR
jgi:hypothetical protein